MTATLFVLEPVKPEPDVTRIAQAELIIAFLNAKTGRRFPARNPKGRPTVNAEEVMYRLADGYSVEDCKSVVAMKVREWISDDKMRQYLNPQTLFRRSNFEKYYGMLGE